MTIKKYEIKESINKILEFGGIVKFPYKKSVSDWYCEISISYNREDNTYYINNSEIRGDYKTKDAIDIFVDFIINDNNLAYVIERIDTRSKHRLCNEYDFEHPNQELIDIIKAEQKLIRKELKNE